ncbi:CRLD2 protein, partial [Amia calva]|nr:CRLD2 protein [Amia calva]
MTAAIPWLCALVLLVLAAQDATAFYLPNMQELLKRYQEPEHNNTTGHSRSRRAIQWSDREEILQLHNKLRGQVHPSASNMEFMVWDDELERSATAWAEMCNWEHGPKELLPFIGQNLAVHWGRYRSPAYHVQAWYDEVKDYTYPYPQECNPWCPERCSGPMCTHYTQMVWATTNKVGCAVNVCKSMSVWGDIWENSVYLVCNYSPKGNWIGEAPYQHGRSCSQCPPSYGGGCKENLCYNADTQVPQRPETEDMNEVEKPQVTDDITVWVQPRSHTPPTKTGTKDTGNKFMAQVIKCETKMRDKCKGPTCNRQELNMIAYKGWLFQQSSICRAALHYGVIDNNGGLVDITRKDRLPFFVKSTKNGIESFSKYKTSNAFIIAKVEEQSIDCYATVAELCPFRKPVVHCPRVYCPATCKDEPSYWAPVIGNNVYSDSSSICRSAIHAGVIKATAGGYVDVLPIDKKKNYVGTLKNGIQSERCFFFFLFMFTTM